MVLTRSASSSPVKKAVQRIDTIPTRPTEAPLRIVIAPKDISRGSRLISLPSPVDGKSQRYLFCPQKGLCELKLVNVPKHDPRSTFLIPFEKEGVPPSRDGPLGSGYVNRSAEYMTATLFDICFILLPMVSQSSKSNLFQSTDDLIDACLDEAFDLKYVMTHSRSLVEQSLASICESIEAGDEYMYRYSPSKTLQHLLVKAKRVCEKGLPATLEDRFVARALEAPILSVRREESTISLSADSQDVPKRVDTPTPSESFDSQSSAASIAPSVVFSETSITTEVSTTTIVPESVTPADVTALQRLLTAFKFITACYTTPAISSTLLGLLRASDSGVDFRPLDTHLERLAKLRADAAASTDLSSFSRKRSNFEDDEEAEDRAEKKRKLDEDEKRKKANTSHGVKALAKVNTKGMKKMSAFFTARPAKPAG